MTAAVDSASPSQGLVVALSGGIGGAKLALGLARTLAPERLMIVANTGDDFEHLGLSISPDLDTLMYTLAGQSDPERGWGRQGETWAFMAALAALGGETWFQIGDGDLATHIERTRRLAAGESLSQITDDFCRRLGVRPRIVPMTDDRVRTRVHTRAGWIDFQDYFVRQRCEPEITALSFEGAEAAKPQPDVLRALRDAGLRAVIICPSNPFISVDPILAVPGMRDALRACHAPVVAVSPIIGGRAVKGPTAKMMRELLLPTTAATVAQHYNGLLDGYVFDEQDAEDVAVPLATLRTRTLMRTLEDREELARGVVAFADTLRTDRGAQRRVGRS
jgi:LPPG:FO 2-phospho-L-lactate transferase